MVLFSRMHELKNHDTTFVVIHFVWNKNLLECSQCFDAFQIAHTFVIGRFMQMHDMV